MARDIQYRLRRWSRRDAVTDLQVYTEKQPTKKKVHTLSATYNGAKITKEFDKKTDAENYVATFPDGIHLSDVLILEEEREVLD